MITGDRSATGMRLRGGETAGGNEALMTPGADAPDVPAAPMSRHYQDLPFSFAAVPDVDLSSEHLRELLAFGARSDVKPASPPSPEPQGPGADGPSAPGEAAIADHLLREALKSGFWGTPANPLPELAAVSDPWSGAGMPQTAIGGPGHQTHGFLTPDASNMLAQLGTLPPDHVALQRALDGWLDGRTAVAVPPPTVIPDFVARPAVGVADRGDQTLAKAYRNAARPPDANGSEHRNALAAAAQTGSLPGIADMTRQWGGGFSSIELEALRADFPILHQQVNGYPLAWLDNAATTQKPRQVTNALTTYYHRDNSNVHRGAHTLAARATDAYENARATVHRLLKSKWAQEIVFVRGTTEGINLVAQSYGRSVLGPGDEVVVTTLEHHSNIVPWQMICREKGAVLRPVPITDAGEIDLNAYLRMLGPKTQIVALAHVSNVLGTVVPVREMTAMAHAAGARVLVDGAQAIAHMPVDVCSIDCDFYTFSGHKVFGPTGVGALYGRTRSAGGDAALAGRGQHDRSGPVRGFDLRAGTSEVRSWHGDPGRCGGPRRGDRLPAKGRSAADSPA